MTFLNPIYLWSLLGIVIPIAIHLWSRRKVITIKVGSTQLLRESEPRQTSTIRLNELWLLFLRILTLLLLALILSQPQLKNKTKNSPLLYIIEPSLVTSQKLENLLAGIPKEAIKLMTEGFPEMEDYGDLTTADNGVPDYWQLAQEMNVLPADSVIVFTKGFRSGLKGKRPVTPSHINWMVLNTDDQIDEIVEAKKKKDSIALLTVFSDADRFQFEKKKIIANSSKLEYDTAKDSVRINEEWIPFLSEQPINILLVYTDSLVQEQEYISAAYRAAATYLEHPIIVETTTNSDSVNIESYDASIWLGVEPQRNIMKTRLIFKPDALSNKLIASGSSKNEYFLTRSLNSENIVAEHLPEKLLALFDLHKGLENKIRPYDKRAVSVEELRPATFKETLTTYQASLIDLSPWLWVLLVVILSTERIIAGYRKQ